MGPLLLAATARAADLPVTRLPAGSLQGCCSALGAAGCPSELLAVGAGSTVSSSGQVHGLWHLACVDGARFDPSGVQSVSPPPGPSDVLTLLSAPQAACFQQSCALPEGLCLKAVGGRVTVVACADDRPPTDGMWRNPPRPPAGAVFVGGRLLGTDAKATAPPSPTPRTSMATTSVVLPPPPPDPCVPNPALRDPSNAQVDAGNSAEVAGDLAQALDRYRAALSINQCNAFAWTAVGDALLELGNAESARAALVTATRLMPAHFHAWTSLGEADEKLGDLDGARRAYRQALATRPGHPPAVAGLARIGG